MPLNRFFVVLACAGLTSRLSAQAAPALPPLTFDAAPGLVVDDYDHGLFSGAFKDDKGSSLDVATVPHADGKHGSYLQARYSLVPGGFVGFWNVPGMAWSTKQDWSKVSALSFAAYASAPLDVTFTIKGDAERQYEASVHLPGDGRWHLVTLPSREWKNVAAGLGVVGGFDVRLSGAGAGVLALDDLVAQGGAPTQQNGQKVELDPKIIFQQSLVPPKDRSKKTYIVDAARGDDGNDGQKRPFRSLQKAVSLLLPGDTVLIKNGDYAEESAEPGKSGVLINRSGAPDAPITIKAFPGHHPTIHSATWATIAVRDAAYIVLDGLDVTSTLNPTEKKNVGTGIGMEHAHHVTVRNCIVHDCGGGGISASYSDYLTIENNRVHDNAKWNIYNCSGISLFEGRDFDPKPGVHNLIRGNMSYRNENRGPTSLYGGKLTDGNGIIVDWNRGAGQTLIERNVCFDNGGRGVHVFHSQNVLVRRNTLVGNNATPDSGPSDARANSSKSITFDSNIIVGRQGQSFDANYQPDNVVYRRNVFWNYTGVDAATVGPDNLIGVDPGFVKMSLDPRLADFRLRSDSPVRARDVGALGQASAPRPLG